MQNNIHTIIENVSKNGEHLIVLHNSSIPNELKQYHILIQNLLQKGYDLTQEMYSNGFAWIVTKSKNRVGTFIDSANVFQYVDKHLIILKNPIGTSYNIVFNSDLSNEELEKQIQHSFIVVNEFYRGFRLGYYAAICGYTVPEQQIKVMSCYTKAYQEKWIEFGKIIKT